MAFYNDQRIVPVSAAAKAYSQAVDNLELPTADNLLDLLPPDGTAWKARRPVDV